MSVGDWSKEKEVEPITEAEYEDIQTQFDDFLVGGTHSDAHVHLYECRQLSRSISENIREKPTSVIPYGYWEVCTFCAYRWRHGGDVDE